MDSVEREVVDFLGRLLPIINVEIDARVHLLFVVEACGVTAGSLLPRKGHPEPLRQESFLAHGQQKISRRRYGSGVKTEAVSSLKMLLEGQALLLLQVFAVLFHVFHHSEDMSVRLRELSILGLS